ncbi:MAG: hypothetical protein LAQ30_02405 [Acidobacteriia bacterium]|nr:hypothetical protein [Terriglobia bacterium]
MEYPELIRFFAAHKVKDIQNVREYEEYCERNLESFAFRSARHEVEVAKQTIEERLDAQATATLQVSQALKLLESRRGLDFDLYHELISAGYKAGWSPEQQKYYDHAARIVRSGNYFFLSFTSRAPAGPGDKRVNRRYWYFIRNKIQRATAGDRRERNLLADAIDLMLRDEFLEGFYYKRHDNDNSIVERKLRDACQSCLVFVQLVDNAMFRPPKAPNYCEFEYRHALEFISQVEGTIEHRTVFLVTEKEPQDLPDPDAVFAGYSDWLKYILSKSAVYLPPVEEYDRTAIDELKAKLAGVVAQVKQARKNLLEKAPG